MVPETFSRVYRTVPVRKEKLWTQVAIVPAFLHKVLINGNPTEQSDNSILQVKIVNKAAEMHSTPIVMVVGILQLGPA